jgi:hypothetical protein
MAFWVGVLILMTMLCLPVAAAPSGSAPLRYADFKACEGKTFTVYRGDSRRQLISLQLVEVQVRHFSPATEQFTLRLRGSGDFPLPKGVYTLESPELGRFSVWLERVRATAEASDYAVDFNLLR